MSAQAGVFERDFAGPAMSLTGGVADWRRRWPGGTQGEAELTSRLVDLQTE